MPAALVEIIVGMLAGNLIWLALLFSQGGNDIEFGAALANAALIATLFFVKVIAKIVAVFSARTLCVQISELAPHSSPSLF
jgi:hypothetical protein